jgi:release factor glutamine methyltransferase
VAPAVSAPALADAVVALRAAGCVFAEDEAEVLGSAAVDDGALGALVRRRADGEPLEQVVGYADFCGVRVRLRPGVFVPRVRSELLVRLAAARADETSPARSDGIAVVVDLCCGSGALGLAVAAQNPRAVLFAADVDPIAVACARDNLGSTTRSASNAEVDTRESSGQHDADITAHVAAGQAATAHQSPATQTTTDQTTAAKSPATQTTAGQSTAGQTTTAKSPATQTAADQTAADQTAADQTAADQTTERRAKARRETVSRLHERVYQGDLFDALPTELAGTIDVLLANVPYVATRHIPLLPAEARDHEPHTALDGGDDGLDVFRAVVAEAPRWLAPGGRLLSEITEAQIDAATAAVRAAGLHPEVAYDEDLEATVVIGWTR